MFGKSNKNLGSSRADSVIGQNTIVEGNIFFQAGIRVYGAIKGHLVGNNERSQLIVFQGGKIHGGVRAANVQVDGEVTGNIICCSIDIRKNARINGNIYYEVLQIEANSVINGELVISDEFNKQKNAKNADQAKHGTPVEKKG